MKNEIIARFLEFRAGGEELPDLNRILLIIRGEKLSLFHVFTFIPEKRSRLPAFTNFDSIHVRKFAKNFRSCKAIRENVKVSPRE